MRKYTKVAGVTFDNDNGTNRQDIIGIYAKEGDTVALVPEPDNPYDANAVGVWLERKGMFKNKRFQIGYLSRTFAATHRGGR